MSLGVMRHFTMDVGCGPAAIGVGPQGRFGCVLTMRLHWWRGLVAQGGESTLASVSAAALAGAHSDSVSPSFRGITRDTATSIV